MNKQLKVNKTYQGKSNDLDHGKTDNDYILAKQYDKSLKKPHAMRNLGIKMMIKTSCLNV